jgi:hypothetical protein
MQDNCQKAREKKRNEAFKDALNKSREKKEKNHQKLIERETTSLQK